MSIEARDKGRDAARRAQEAEAYPRRTLEAAELQALSLSKIADALARLADQGEGRHE